MLRGEWLGWADRCWVERWWGCGGRGNILGLRTEGLEGREEQWGCRVRSDKVLGKVTAYVKEHRKMVNIFSRATE